MAASKAKVRDIDRGWNKIKRKLNKGSGKRVKVGFQTGDLDDNNTSIALIAAYNEFGTERIPSRPFMRNAYRKNLSTLNTLKDGFYNQILGCKLTVEQGLDRLGVFMESKIRNEITSLRNPPNAPSTIRQKKSSNPLIDTGVMRASVRYVIE